MLILAFYIFGMKNYEISEEVRHDFVYGRQEVLFALSHNPRPLDQSDYPFYEIIILLFFFIISLIFYQLTSFYKKPSSDKLSG